MAFKLASFSKKTPGAKPAGTGGVPAAKKKADAKLKKFKAAKGEKFVLFVGDEGAILISMKNNEVLSRQFVPDASPANLDELRTALHEKPKAPVILVVDTLDQTYVQQTLPPVSAMSVGKLIKRRLDRDFAGNELKGALVLGREKGGRKDWNFLMIALDKSPQLMSWIGFLDGVENRFSGIYLAAVEIESLVKLLDVRLHPNKAAGSKLPGSGSEWKFFVSHNKVGGFRQVILRGGRIVFTRLAQPVGEANPEVVAGSIEQEMLSTIEYMKRLSYNPAAGLDIYIIASTAIKESIDSNKFMATHVHLLTPFEVAGHLDIDGATQPTDQFGDVILAAMIGATRKHVLKFNISHARKVDVFYQLLLAQRAVAVMGAVGLFGYMGYISYDMFQGSQQMADMERQKSVEQRKLSELRDEIKNSNIDIEKVSDVIDLYKTLREETISPLPFIARFEPIILSPIRIQSLEWRLQEETVGKKGREAVGRRPAPASARGAAPPVPNPNIAAQPATPALPEGATKKILPQMEAKLSLEFPVPVDDPRGVQVIQQRLLKELGRVFAAPFYTVTIPGAEAKTEAESDTLEINFAQSGNEKPAAAPATGAQASSSKTEILIKGDVIPGNDIFLPDQAAGTTQPVVTVPAEVK